MHSGWFVRGAPLLIGALLGACGSDSGSGSQPGGAGAGGSSGGAPGMGGGGGTAGASVAGAPAAGAAGASVAGAGAGGSTGGASGSAGTAGSAGSSGAAGSSGSAGSGGAPALIDVAKAVNGLRVEDPCEGTPAADHTCKHVGSMADADAFALFEEALIAGTAGTKYSLKVRVRGATEPTHTQGGKAGTPANFVVGGMPYARGTNEANYEYWRIAVDSPAQVYYLNSFDATGLSHLEHLLDYEVVIPVNAGAHLRLEMRDENGHEISNDGGLHPDGVTAAPQNGEYVQLDVVSVELAAP